MAKKMKIFSGSANPYLAQKITKYMDFPLSGCELKKFSDGENFVRLLDNVRGADVFLIQPTCTPVNEHLIELIIMIDACRRASARRITAVMPYYGYARQDRKTDSKTPITAKTVANMLVAAGARRVLTMDLHSGQIQGFFDIPLDNLQAMPVILDDIRQRFDNDFVMVSPDAGGAERVRAHAKRLGTGLAIIDKRRERANESKVMNVIGDVKRQHAILLDDMADTAGTLCGGAAALKKAGAKSVHAYCTHPVLSGPAISRIKESKIKTITVTDTIPLTKKARNFKKIRTVSVAEMFGRAIRRINEEGSLSDLFV